MPTHKNTHKAVREVTPELADAAARVAEFTAECATKKVACKETAEVSKQANEAHEAVRSKLDEAVRDLIKAAEQYKPPEPEAPE